MHDIFLAASLLFEVETTTTAPRPEESVCEIVETAEDEYLVACAVGLQHV